MMDGDNENIKRWVNAWQRAGPLLEIQRVRDFCEVDTPSSVEAFIRIARWLGPDSSRSDSGLVEQQRWFRMLRES